MQINAQGCPLHTRTLSVTLLHAAPGRVAFSGYVLDLRKRGFAPVGGDLQGTGIVHHMQLDGTIDAERGLVESINSRMQAVAFEPTAATGGETCRDVAGRAALLAGTPLDDQWARVIGTEIGGPRGCSHILTLTQLLGPTVRQALATDRAVHGAHPERRVGERIFRRDVTIDGYELDGGDLYLVAQLSDMLLAPAAPICQPMDRFGHHREIRVVGTAALMRGLEVTSLDAAERTRVASELTTASWQSRTDRVTPLVGRTLRSGISSAILEQFRDAGNAGTGEAALRDTLLQLAPTTIQCFAALDLWTTRFTDSAAADTGGLPDSCYVWRRGGHLGRWRDGAVSRAKGGG